jgi:uncharacterized protein YkwD
LRPENPAHAENDAADDAPNGRGLSPAAPPPPITRPPAPVSNVAVTGAESTLIAMINGFRRAHGLPPLAAHWTLANEARSWASHMASGGCGSGSNGLPNLCHSSLSSDITVPWSALAENVGMISPRANIAGMESMLEHSLPHAQNMMNPKMQYVGVGFAYVGDYMFVAEEFMAG